MSLEKMPNGRGYGTDLQGDELSEAFFAMGLGKTPEGGYSPGTKVRKINSQVGDVTFDGTEGVVKGGVSTKGIEISGIESDYGYLVEWDDPELPKDCMNFIISSKLEEIK